MGKKRLVTLGRINYLSLEEICEGVDFAIFDNCALAAYVDSKGHSNEDNTPKFKESLIYGVEKGLPIFIPTYVKSQFLSEDRRIHCELASLNGEWKSRERLVNLLEKNKKILDVKQILGERKYQEQINIIRNKDLYKVLEETDLILFAISTYFSKKYKVALVTNDGKILGARREVLQRGVCQKQNFKAYCRRKQLNPCFEFVNKNHSFQPN